MSTTEAARQLASEMSEAAPGIAREFIYRRAHAPAPDTWGSMVGADEQAFAERLVVVAASVVSGETSVGDALAASGDLGVSTAAQGLSAAELVVWITAVETLIHDKLDATGSGTGDVARRQSLGVVAQWFDALRAFHLHAYEDARDELAGWYLRLGTDLISYLASGTPIDGRAVSSQARALGMDPNQAFRAVAVRIDDDTTEAHRRLARRRLAHVFKQFQPDTSILAQEKGDLVLALVPMSRSGERLVPLLGELLDDDEMARTLYVVVGEQVDSLAKAGRTCRQALSALEIAVYRSYRGRVTQCTEVILEVLLANNQWVAQRLVDSRLGAIVDTPHLVETLRAYVRCDMALQRAAEELFIHPNTVAYRLRQIAKRTGRDMRRAADLTELSMALAALDVVRMQADRDVGHGDLRAQLLSS